MKKLLFALSLLILTSFSSFSQSIYAGEWMGVITPSKQCANWGRTTLWVTVSPDGLVGGDQWDFFAINQVTLFSGIGGALSPRGVVTFSTESGAYGVLKLSKSGKGSGVWNTPIEGTVPLAFCRQTVTLFRQY